MVSLESSLFFYAIKHTGADNQMHNNEKKIQKKHIKTNLNTSTLFKNSKNIQN